jgi:hypothetical protein
VIQNRRDATANRNGARADGGHKSTVEFHG